MASSTSRDRTKAPHVAAKTPPSGGEVVGIQRPAVPRPAIPRPTPRVVPAAAESGVAVSAKVEALEFREPLKTDDFEVIEVVKPSPPPPPPPAPVAAPVAAPRDPSPWAIPANVQSRASAADIIDLLFDAMHELHFFETAVEGASYCLSVVLRAIPSRAGLVSLYDIDSREFVVAYSQGPHAERLLLSRSPESDPLISAAMSKYRPMSIFYGEDSASAPDRFAFFGEMRSVLVAPVIDDGRFLAVIELVDPLDGTNYSEAEINALNYVSEHFAEYLSARGSAVGKVVAPPSGMVEAEPAQ